MSFFVFNRMLDDLTGVHLVEMWLGRSPSLCGMIWSITSKVERANRHSRRLENELKCKFFEIYYSIS